MEAIFSQNTESKRNTVIAWLRNRIVLPAAIATTAILVSTYAAPRVTQAADAVVEESITYAAHSGVITLDFSPATLEELGFSFVASSDLEEASSDQRFVLGIDTSSALHVETTDGIFSRLGGGVLRTRGALLLDKPGNRIVVGNFEIEADSYGTITVASTLDDTSAAGATFELVSVMIDLDSARDALRLIGELAITNAWASALELEDAAGTVIGTIAIEAELAFADDVQASACAPRLAGESDTADRSAKAVGSDVLVAELQSVRTYLSVGNISAYAIGTTACNIGTARANWIQHSNQHPVIVQNLYRLMDDKFEQIGLSWVKHGFYAVSQSLCTPCNDPTNGTQLGVGCSDPYSATLNGVQGNMSPRFGINPHTGYFQHPWDGPAAETTIERRLQVNNIDLDPVFNFGARYFMQGHYIHPDDCTAGTQNNNASYREVTVERNIISGLWDLIINQSWATQRGQSAIRAWQDVDPSVVETDIQIPGEGLFTLSCKVIETGTGAWRYYYALMNLNSDRSGRLFSVPLPEGALISNVGFHDVNYHSGDPVDATDWDVEIGPDSITWSTDTYAENENANALRYGTIYNFYFDSNIQPSSSAATLGLFKAGLPSDVHASTLGPKLLLADCNDNDIADACDIDCAAPECSVPCGTSLDCNANDVPDECESDCNDNGIADACDLADCQPEELWCADCNENTFPDECDTDCDGNGVPDECEALVDTDHDGISDCYDLCPLTTVAHSCACPSIDRCCWFDGTVCIDNYPRLQCTLDGGTPNCSEAPCRLGCIIGDADLDGDLDLEDVWAFQRCIGADASDQECSIRFDFDGDDNIDLDDFEMFDDFFSGP
jgi:hypothetical protein